ncbi:MAG TPA: TIGR03016 family PEP-CTERM system-associated outer membrane protein [Burkholderiaceae bacterium]|nr:TIGR03016 family PEP-CTERM system-associated outer membrane protein [Burkholderiaceae bacterium]
MLCSRSTRCSRGLVARINAAAFALACATAAHAQSWSVEPFIRTTVTATSNANFNREESARSDTIFEVTPGIRASGRGPQWSADAAFSVQGVAYASGSQQNRALPEGGLRVNGELIKNWFFIETGASAIQQTEDVFGARPVGPSTYNKFTVAQYRVSPYIDHEFSGGLGLFIRSDNGWTDTLDAPPRTNDGYYGLHTVRLSQRPQPVGGALEYTRTETRFSGQDQDAFFEEIGRGVLSYALGPTLVVGVVGGYDHYKIPFFDDQQSLYGARANWRPSERTLLDIDVEDRFFGRSWRVLAQHRLPQVAFDARWSRDVTTSPQAIFSLQPTGNVAGLINESLGASIRDPIQREKAVRDFMAQRGLPESLPGSVNIYSQRVTINQTLSGTVTLIGARNTLAFTAFRTRIEALRTQIEELFALDPLADNNEQTGFGVSFARRLSPITRLTLTALRFDTHGLGENSDTKTNQTSMVSELSRQFGRRASWLIGLRWQHINSNIATDATEYAAYTGLLYRF